MPQDPMPDREEQRMYEPPLPTRCPVCGFIDHHPACPEQASDLPYPDEESHDIDD